MKRLLMPFLLSLMLVFVGCTKEGPTGPMGPQGSAGEQGEVGETGDQGEPGVSLIKEYTGTIPFDGSSALNVPEITGKRATTFVMAYWTFSTTPNIWIPMTDGWLDSAELAHMFTVSWTYGRVYFYGMVAGDFYLVQVFQHN